MAFSRPTGRGLGILLYLVSIFFFALNDALGKWLVADYGVGQLLLLRSVGSSLVLGPMIWRLRAELFDGRHLGLQIARVLCMALDTYCFYYATRTMPLADVMTFYMAAPLLVTALSAALLREHVEPFRWLAVGVGFVGVVIALQPSPALLSSASPLALLGATMFALGQTVTRRLRGTHWLQLVVWQFAGAGVIGATTLPWILGHARRARSRAAVSARHRLDAVLHPAHPRARDGARLGVGAFVLFLDGLGDAARLDRLARRADAADLDRQRDHHRQRVVRGGNGEQGGRAGGRGGGVS